MTMMQVGSLAAALVSVWTLVGKLVRLIASIQSLIDRLDKMQEDLANHRFALTETQKQIQDHALRLRVLELHQGELLAAQKRGQDYVYESSVV